MPRLSAPSAKILTFSCAVSTLDSLLPHGFHDTVSADCCFPGAPIAARRDSRGARSSVSGPVGGRDEAERQGSAGAEWKRHFHSEIRLLPVILDTKRDRKSTRLNSSHLGISYAVFC